MKPTRELLNKLYWEERKSLSEIARMYQKHYSTVRKWLIENKIPRRKKGERKDVWTNDEVKILMKNKSKGAEEIHKKLPHRSMIAIWEKSEQLGIKKLLEQAKEKLKKRYDLDSAEWAYLAGLIDGEGTVTLSMNNRNQPHALLEVSNTNTNLLNWIKIRFPEVCVMREANGGRNPRWKKRYEVAFHGFKSVPILKKVLPFLVIKKEQAELVLEFLESRVKSGLGRYSPKEREICKKIRRLNKRGKHEGQ